MQTQAPAQVEQNPGNPSAPASLNNGGLTRITPKPAIRTSQLWLIVGVVALLGATVFAGKLDAQVLALIAPGIAITYLFVREGVYRDAANHPDDVVDKTLGTILGAIPEPDMHAIPAIIAALKGLPVSPIVSSPEFAVVGHATDGHVAVHPAAPTPAQFAAPDALSPALSPAPSPAPSAPSTETAVPLASAGASSSISALSMLLAALFGASFLLTGCGTPFGNDVANALESPASQKIISAAVSFGVNSLSASLGSKVSPDLQTAITTAGGAVADGVAWSTVYAGAELLRSKQSTASSAKAGVLTATLMQAGLPQDKATVVATSVATLNQKGVPADVANEAVASALDGAAAAKAPVSSSNGKAIVPTQARNRRPHFRIDHPELRTLYGENDQPIYPAIVTHQED